MTVFYRSAEERDMLLSAVMKRGRVVDAPLFLDGGRPPHLVPPHSKAVLNEDASRCT